MKVQVQQKIGLCPLLQRVMLNGRKHNTSAQINRSVLREVPTPLSACEGHVQKVHRVGAVVGVDGVR